MRILDPGHECEIDMEQKDKLMKYYSEIYENYMSNIYDIIKKLI